MRCFVSPLCQQHVVEGRPVRKWQVRLLMLALGAAVLLLPFGWYMHQVNEIAEVERLLRQLPSPYAESETAFVPVPASHAANTRVRKSIEYGVTAPSRGCLPVYPIPDAGATRNLKRD